MLTDDLPATRTGDGVPTKSGPTLSIVVPTFNERDNVAPIIEAISAVFPSGGFEIIFVDDDSPDGTTEIAKKWAANDPRIRCIRRVGRRGLASAAIEGFLSSSADHIALMDGDLQHDEAILPDMLACLESGSDLVIASRHASGGSNDGLSGPWRRRLSQLGGRLANSVLGTAVSDPMSGFFMMRRDRFDELAPNLSARGFKALADIISAPGTKLSITEIPYTFRKRTAGTSKLDQTAMLDFATVLLDKTVGRFVPLQFILFCVVGGSGVIVHLGILAVALKVAGLPFMVAQAIAALSAMTTNFLLNNAYTFSDRRLRGLKLIIGLLTYYVICTIGFVANVGVGDFLFGQGRQWWLAGLLGALVGAVWNFAVSSAFTWGRK